MLRRRAEGFSLIELMLVTAVVATIGAMAIPALAGGLRRYAMLNSIQQVASTVRSARVQAVGKNQALRVRFDSPAAAQYQILDTMDNAVGAVQTLPAGIVFAVVSSDLQFNPSGRVTAIPAGAPPVTITISNGTAAQNRTITVTSSGRVQVP
jgi:prepilin-type N-terminal cleavage/methylation domain-containing protein